MISILKTLFKSLSETNNESWERELRERVERESWERERVREWEREREREREREKGRYSPVIRFWDEKSVSIPKIFVEKHKIIKIIIVMIKQFLWE